MKDRLKNVPLNPGVYMFKDEESRVIYVGKAKALRNRLRSYFQSPEGLDPKVRVMMSRVADFDYIVTNSEVEALILENNLIKSYQPRYNINLRDDKTYPYLKITTGEKFPRISVVREEKDRASRYFGPYTDVTSLRETLRLLTSIFPVRTCKNFKNKTRPCLNKDIDKCLAPCSGKLSHEEYNKVVVGLIDFLEGNYKDLLKQKEEEMQIAANNLEFEKAARIRDQINAINKVSAKQKISFDAQYKMDVIGMVNDEKNNLVLVLKLRAGKIIGKDTFWLKKAIDEKEEEILGFLIKQYYDENPDIPGEIIINLTFEELELIESWLKEKTQRSVKIKVPKKGEKKQLLDMVLDNAKLLWDEKMNQDLKNEKVLQHLSKVLNIEVVPERIECFDISHLAGEETVASMVVLTKAVPDKMAYRRFKIKIDKNDDFAAMSEALKRRFTQAREGNESFLPEPDLILIDGGLGQVNAVQNVINELGVDIPVFGLAKKNEEIFKPGISKPIVLPRRDEALMVLQRARDEAHRFAIEYNRKLRSKKVTKSALDEIEGIGEKRKKNLLKHFGSVAKIREASVEQLLEVPGINKNVAKNIEEYFK
ncbi:Excinuclease ABC subunit C [Candidatus Syntrophocurvum alkaliphilum]|uniref:UvrABC system protein C n=1 Tax=Candidatus Syntrophocurvum alkaliphilum TaxID=2293317 RepID=A0A6I6DCI4_9FIRM|nr:excinuclease ABC subunit UvrC [Candidatus Syntrophocurvum alkaliphilum]QGU00375.1 Excinuclease ABC subunit C [Candidatus Syntrophocurvum alkaliphilum]